jgi:glycosyltransferase involved in cell wall biosynthesis
MSEAPAVSVVLAAYDEAATVGEVVRGALAACPAGSEVVVADDGSRDDTAAVSEAAGARVLRLSPNRGKGHALRQGITAARGDVLVFLDADGQDDPAEIPKLLGALEGGADLVVGSRFLGRFGRGAITPLNRAGNRFLTLAFNALYGTAFTDTQAGFKALRRSAIDVDVLCAERFDIEVEVLARVVRRGLRYAEVPVSREARAHGESRLDSFRDGARILLRMARVRLT